MPVFRCGYCGLSGDSFQKIDTHISSPTHELERKMRKEEIKMRATKELEQIPNNDSSLG